MFYMYNSCVNHSKSNRLVCLNVEVIILFKCTWHIIQGCCLFHKQLHKYFLSTAKRRKYVAFLHRTVSLCFSLALDSSCISCLRHLLFLCYTDQIRGHKSSQCSERLKNLLGNKSLKTIFEQIYPSLAVGLCELA